MRAYHSARVWLVPALVAGLCTACAPAHGGRTSSGAFCATRLPLETPQLETPEPAEVPRSRIAVELLAETTLLGRELERRVPVTLAQASRRPVGAPGEATYRVWRGPLSVGLERERLMVTTRVKAQIEVCKPLGFVCVTYGSCSPEFVASVSVPVVLGAHYELGASRASIQLTRPCVIMGADVSSEIRDIARREVAGVESRVNAELPKLEPQVQAAWKLLHLPIALGAGPCLRIEPERVTQSRPRLANGMFSTSLAVFGRVSLEEPCAAEPRARAETTLPPPELLDDLAPGIDLEVPLYLDWADVSAELSRSLVGPLAEGSGTRVLAVQARGARSGHVAVSLTLEGTICGEVWLLAEPFYDAGLSRVRLRTVRVAPGQPDRAKALDHVGLERAIETRASIALPVDLSRGPAALKEWVARLTRDRPPEVSVEVSFAPVRVDRVLADARALVPIARVTGSARVRLAR